jgi:flagellar biosynthetic protein FliO
VGFDGGALLSILYSIIVVIVIFFLAWFVTRLVASKSSFAGQGKNIKILEKVAISKDSCIMLVEAFGKLLLVGTTAQGMTMLKEIDSEGIDMELFHIKKESFADILKSTLDQTLPNGKVKSKVNDFFDNSRYFRKKGGNGDEKK